MSAVGGIYLRRRRLGIKMQHDGMIQRIRVLTIANQEPFFKIYAPRRVLKYNGNS